LVTGGVIVAGSDSGFRSTDFSLGLYLISFGHGALAGGLILIG